MKKLKPERGRAWLKVTRLQGWEDGRLELSLLLPRQLPLGSVQAENSSVACSYSLKVFLLG